MIILTKQMHPDKNMMTHYMREARERGWAITETAAVQARLQTVQLEGKISMREGGREGGDGKH